MRGNKREPFDHVQLPRRDCLCLALGPTRRLTMLQFVIVARLTRREEIAFSRREHLSRTYHLHEKCIDH